MNPFYGAAAAAFLLIASFGAGWHFRGQSAKLQSATSEIQQDRAEDAKRTTDQATVAEEAKTYEAATDPLAPLPAPVVRMCYQPPAAPALSSPHSAGSGAHEAPPVRAPDPPAAVPGPDIGRPLVQISHNADAQVAGLQDYIERVCQAKAP